MSVVKRSPKERLLGLLAFLMPLLAAGAAHADEVKVDSGDTAWMLTSTALVLLMTIPGLALFYAGLVRRKNVIATAAQSFATTCLVAVLWFVCSYSLAFTNGSPFLGDLSRLFLSGMDVNSAFLLGAGTSTPAQTTIPESVFMMFQMTFAIITPALITGAFADRMKFSALLWFMGLWSVLVYAPVAHWVWQPNGFLAGLGVLDFAGGTVVHINAGIAALVCALVIGKRQGYPLASARSYSPLQALVGASLLWVGWFGFNAGSAVASNGRAGMAMAVTMIATAVAALSWMATEWKMRGKPSSVGLISGAVAGLVAITPASGFVDPMGSFFIGLVAGAACYLASTVVKGRFKYDDSLDVFGVHGVAGVIGALLTGVFAKAVISGSDSMKGLIDGNAAQLWVQAQGVAVTILWSAVMTYVILKIVNAIVGLRVSQEEEIQGLDLSLHGETLDEESASSSSARREVA